MARLAVLMVTYDQPDYLKLSLPRLLDTCGDDARVWLWHNGTDGETLELARTFATDERVDRFHHCSENEPLRDPTNWLFTESTGDLVSKVDDDCLVPDGWVPTFLGAHDDVEQLGAVGCWRFPDEDFVPELAMPKVGEFAGGHRILQNYWVQGSSFVMKRACVERHGARSPPARPSRSISCSWRSGVGQRLVLPVPAGGAHGRPPVALHALPHRRGPAGPPAADGPAQRGDHPRGRGRT